MGNIPKKREFLGPNKRPKYEKRGRDVLPPKSLRTSAITIEERERMKKMSRDKKIERQINSLFIQE